MTAAAVIVAGGQGLRMQAGRNKVFIEIGGRSILERSLALFDSMSLIDEIVLVTRVQDLRLCEGLRSRFQKLTKVVPGGEVRHRSEFSGVQALAGRIDANQIETVLVHYAVRPFASRQLVERVLGGSRRAEACVPGLPAAPTTVLVDDGWISDYPSNLWAVQTPQAVQATWLLEAHNKAARQGFIGTDTASVVEWAGGQVAVVEGEPGNIKITTPADLAMAEGIAARLAQSG